MNLVQIQKNHGKRDNYGFKTEDSQLENSGNGSTHTSIADIMSCASRKKHLLVWKRNPQRNTAAIRLLHAGVIGRNQECTGWLQVNGSKDHRQKHKHLEEFSPTFDACQICATLRPSDCDCKMCGVRLSCHSYIRCMKS